MKTKHYCIFAKYLYIGDKVKHPERVKWKLQHGAGQAAVYLLAQAPENRDALVLIHAGFLKQSYYKTNPLKVYGIAMGYSEAKQLLVQISDEAIAQGMPGALKAYLDKREATNTGKERKD